jgi:methylenetetrahydrofolate--tRNA-(uracil-5-)-methyltransferase
MKELTIIGGGLAGTEAAWQAANMGIHVKLYEMRPHKSTPVHKTSFLGELVCSNSLGSVNPDRPAGLLKKELQLLGSIILDCAQIYALPAGSALSVDREKFSKEITRRIMDNGNIELIRQEVEKLPLTPCIIATGPLTSDLLAQQILKFTESKYLYFYDAIAPVIEKDEIDFSIAFYASRYGIGENEKGDYINCPFSKQEYDQFVNELRSAKRIPLRDFEIQTDNYFEACLPVEVIATRSNEALAYGPMRPIGISKPGMQKKPYAVVQLRQDNLAASLYNMVGFQTNLTYNEQDRVFHMIPGLKNVIFIQYGQMHRNTYLCSPRILLNTLQTIKRKDLFFAGQITGLEGYLCSIASGIVAGRNAARILLGRPPLLFPQKTMIGALCNYISKADPDHFQPMKANFGLLPDLPIAYQSKFERAHQKSLRAINELQIYINDNKV